jgi:thiol-disulfide isomerase/thioredoxin
MLAGGLAMHAALCLAAAPAREPRAVRLAFAECSARLAHVTNYAAGFAVTFDSIKGVVAMTGTIVQQPPFAFRRELCLEELNSGTTKRECSVCNGTNGWQVEYAPNGRAVNVSRWGAAAMEELCGVFMRNAQLVLLTPDRTSTYASLRQAITFDAVSACAGGHVFHGRDRDDTPAHQELLRVAGAYGPQGVSNYMARSVRLVIDRHGLPVELSRENLLGRVIECARLTNVVVNQPLPPALFAYQPPAEIMVFDLERAMETEPIHVAHPLRDKPGPAFSVAYLNGKVQEIKPGGDVLVLTFFTSWSDNCRSYLPLIEQAYRTYANRGVKFVTVTDEKKQTTLKQLISTARLTMPVYLDHDGVVAKTYKINIVPKTLILNRRGIVCDVLEGNARGVARELDAAIAAALAGPAADSR